MNWQLVPNPATEKMCLAGADTLRITEFSAQSCHRAMCAAAPKSPYEMTKEEAVDCQNWQGMDGATAFHLIDRHANGWADTGRMMQAWLEANLGVVA